MKAAEPAIISKDATVLGFRIHYLEAGRGDPVILLHGMGGEGARWMPTIRGLASQFRVITPGIRSGLVRLTNHSQRITEAYSSLGS